MLISIVVSREIELWGQDGVLEAPDGISGQFYARD
jgi:hypothetical protein